MSIVIELDPFTQVYNALWQMVERNKTLMELIPVGNRIKVERDSPPKSAISNADTPELMLLLAGASYFPHNDSSNSSVTKRYIWYVTSGNFMVNPFYNPISFELFRCMVDWEDILCPLVWNTCTFVTSLRLTDADEDLENNQTNRDILGWSGLITVEVDFTLPTNKLRINQL